jgi:protein required for attachment to host cells
MAERLWIVAIDGEHVRFFEREAPAGRVVENEQIALHTAPAQPPRDRAPRVHDRMGAGRHRIEARVTPEVAHERAFLRSVVDLLEQRFSDGAFDTLVLSAPPRAAGYLRTQLSAALKESVKDFWVKDLTKATARDVEQRLDEFSKDQE